MIDQRDLAALMADPARAAEVPVDVIPSVLSEVSAQEAKLSTVKAILAARLAAPSTRCGPDRLLTAEQVHELTTMSVDWLYRHADALPFARRIGRKVLFSEAELDKWQKTRRCS